MTSFVRENKHAIYGGIIATLFSGLGVFLLGNVSGYEAKQLLTSSLRGIDMLCNTIILASATILTLLLTLLSISSGTKSKIKQEHYSMVKNIAKLDTILFITGLILFQLFNIPITETDTVPTGWFETIYWAVLISTSILSGTMIVVILMLYNTVTNIIHIVGIGKDHQLILDDKSRDTDEENE
ncbi:hypothetical protein KUV50_13110 [Membranicola marinus]|uniref:Uncharacterized protein n=1 Tax=Membranihabitans marinus TaxID=1227546 RepID=A0A953LDP2_9BACT|nr:hypothetical protein [Membranihabitans marinus]MBY5959084.1 hypothetical protein [Membranihabitans marinus]